MVPASSGEGGSGEDQGRNVRQRRPRGHGGCRADRSVPRRVLAQFGRQKRIRGAEMVTTAKLRRRVHSAYYCGLARLAGGKWLRPYSVSDMLYLVRTETQHTIVSGTTGSGKTVLISDLVSQICAKGEHCVLYDKMGSDTRSFFDYDRDVLMNPLDPRAALVADDAAGLHAQIQSDTGERIAALEGSGKMKGEAAGKGVKVAGNATR